MDDIFIAILSLILLVLIVGVFVLPITALVIAIRTRTKLANRVAKLEELHGQAPGQSSGQASISLRVDHLNTRIRRLEQLTGTTDVAEPEKRVELKPQPVVEPISPVSSAPPPITPTLSPSLTAGDIESMIGRRWVGWAAVSLILFATAFFLKYAFDNRWIGELGRVAIGIGFGVLMTMLGFRYFKRGWRVFSQILTGGGIVLLYLSTYAAFGYYHLVPQKTAFAFLAILIAEAAALSLLYVAPSIAIMALVGGFLTPLLLHSDHDQHVSLFAYIIAIDIGALALLKHWRGLRTLAFLGSHLLFWIWYDEHYHEQSIAAVVTFHVVLFAIFLASHLASRLLRKIESTTLEDLWLLGINPFIFFTTAYHLLNPQHHDWMGVFAILLALIYAGTAKLLLDRVDGATFQRLELLVLIGIALTFVTIVIPIQLRSNWITIAWAIEGLMMLWAGIETGSKRMRLVALTLFGLTLVRLFLWDTPYGYRPPFIPIFNRYFLSSLAVVACLFAAAAMCQSFAKEKNLPATGMKLALLLAAVISLWLVLSIETQTFFTTRAMIQRVADDARHEHWLGQMALSVVWAVYAAVLAAIGFLRRSSATRWAALSLFALTVIKAMLVDLAGLQQLYRIIVFFVLGLLLLLVAWAYHRAFQARESSV